MSCPTPVAAAGEFELYPIEPSEEFYVAFSPQAFFQDPEHLSVVMLQHVGFPAFSANRSGMSDPRSVLVEGHKDRTQWGVYRFPVVALLDPAINPYVYSEPTKPDRSFTFRPHYEPEASDMDATLKTVT